jgi:hypothetical protein
MVNDCHLPARATIASCSLGSAAPSLQSSVSRRAHSHAKTAPLRPPHRCGSRRSCCEQPIAISFHTKSQLFVYVSSVRQPTATHAGKVLQLHARKSQQAVEQCLAKRDVATRVRLNQQQHSPASASRAKQQEEVKIELLTRMICVFVSADEHVIPPAPDVLHLTPSKVCVSALTKLLARHLATPCYLDHMAKCSRVRTHNLSCSPPGPPMQAEVANSSSSTAMRVRSCAG